MKIRCPGCAREFSKDLFPLGDEVNCPYCEKNFRLSQGMPPLEKPQVLESSPVPVEEEKVSPHAPGKPVSLENAEEKKPKDAPAEPPVPEEGPVGKPTEPPAGPVTSIEVRTQDSDVEVAPSSDGEVGFRGDEGVLVTREGGRVCIEVPSGKGEVEIYAPPSIPLRIVTKEGTVRAAKLQAPLDIETVSGNIAVANHQGDVLASSENGTLWSRNIWGRSLRFTSVSGDITLEGWAGRGSDLEIICDSGEVTVSVDPNASSFQYVLESRTGGVNAFPVVQGTFRKLEGLVGQGEGSLRVHNRSGDVSLSVGYGDDGGQRIQGRVTRARGASTGWVGFLGHLGVFGAVSGGLAAVNYLTSPGYPWFLWAMGPWGLGLALHLWGVVTGSRGPKRCCEPEFVVRRKTPLLGFFHGLGPFVAVNAFLVFVDLWTDGALTWAYWVTIFWGVAVTIHLWTALLRTFANKHTEPVTPGELARRRDRMETQWRRQLHHLGVYALVNGFILAINLAVSPGHLWFVWVLAPWGIGMVIGLWRAGVSTAHYWTARSVAPRPTEGEKASLLPMAMFQLSLWAAFALTGFALPVFGREMPLEGVLQPQVSSAFTGVGAFALEFPFVYWGIAILASILAFTVFLSASKTRLLSLGFFALSSAFLAATAYAAVMVAQAMAG